VLHRAAYAALGLDGWRYDAIDTTSEELPALIAGLDSEWVGLSLTMPLKQTVIPLLDHVEPLADVVGSVNTVLVQPGPRTSLVGANTDVYGLVAALREGLGDRPVRSAVVLGAGATAASALAALGELGCASSVVLARSLGRTGGLRRAIHRMGVDADIRPWTGDITPLLVDADVVVSTVPAHAGDQAAADLADAYAGMAPTVRGVLLDVVYDPRPTALLSAWASAGGAVVSGERMLLHQAAEQVRLMTGQAAPLAAMDVALACTL
jgi:shikimate dehydrogenase